MIKFIRTAELSNAFVPKYWELTPEPFVAYRAKGQDNPITMNITNEFNQNWPSKVIETKKGTKLLINCSIDQDEKIALVSLTGQFRSVMRIYVRGDIDIIKVSKYSEKHCVPTQFLVARFNSEDAEIVMLTSSKHRSSTLDRVTIIKYNSIKVLTDTEFFEQDSQKDPGLYVSGIDKRKYRRGLYDFQEKLATLLEKFTIFIVPDFKQNLNPEIQFYYKGQLQFGTYPDFLVDDYGTMQLKDRLEALLNEK